MEPVLAIPDIDREMRVEADVSDYVTGGVLLLKYEDGKWRPVVRAHSVRHQSHFNVVEKAS